MENNWHICSVHSCKRPVFCLTLCRGCYRGFRVQCNVDNCNRPSFCKQVCIYHYRRKEIPPPKLCSEMACSQIAYIGRCFKCYVKTKCSHSQCNNNAFARNKCQKHYMKDWRNEKRVISKAV